MSSNQNVPSRRERWIALRRKYTKAEVPDEFFNLEFTRLKSLPGVSNVWVAYDDEIVVTFQAIYEHKAEYYYLGTYELKLVLNELVAGEPRKGFFLKCIRSGRHDGGTTLPYQNGSGLGGFCFSTKEAFLLELCKAGEIFVLITTVIDYVSHLNSGSNKQQEYRRIYGNNVLEPATKMRHMNRNITAAFRLSLRRAFLAVRGVR